MRRASSSSRLLLRITDYGHDNTFFLAKHSLHFGSPRPSAGEGSAVTGQAHSWRSRNHSGNLIQGCVPGIDSAERCPPHPSPSPALGRGEPMSATVAISDQLAEVSR